MALSAWVRILRLPLFLQKTIRKTVVRQYNNELQNYDRLFILDYELSKR